MQKFVLTIVILCLINVSLIEAKASRQNTQCGKYEKEMKNSKGQVKCIPNKESCVGEFFL